MVTVVIASADRLKPLLACIDSVTRSDPEPSGGLQLIVVSGTYTSSEREDIKSAGATVISSAQRMLTAPAQNIGAASARGEYVLFLDDDNVVAPDTIWLLARTLETSADAALVGPVMYYGSVPERIWCAGVERTKVFMRTKLRAHLPVPLPAVLPSDDFPNCFMLRRHDFERIGGFDVDRFPTHMAEGDLARRLVVATGGHVFCVTHAKVWHFIGTSLSRRLHMHDAQRAYWVARGRALYTALYGSPLQWLAFVTLGQWALMVVYMAAIVVRAEGSRARALVAYARGMEAGIRLGFAARKSTNSSSGGRITQT